MKRFEMKDVNYDANENIGNFQARPPKLQPFCEERGKWITFKEDSNDSLFPTSGTRRLEQSGLAPS